MTTVPDVEPTPGSAAPLEKASGVPLSTLAEGRWLWRRIFVFATTGGLLGLQAVAVQRAEYETLPHVADGLTHLMALLLVLYLVAPTAQQIVELLASLKLRLAGGGKA